MILPTYLPTYSTQRGVIFILFYESIVKEKSKITSIHQMEYFFFRRFSVLMLNYNILTNWTYTIKKHVLVHTLELNTFNFKNW